MCAARLPRFYGSMWSGTRTLAYTCRATTPGSFTAPPATAEDMYAAESFGRSASALVVVADAEEAAPPGS